MDMLLKGHVANTSGFNLDFLEINESGRQEHKFVSHAYFSKHRSQGRHLSDPDEVKYKNSRSPFTDTVGLYFGGFKTNQDERLKNFSRKHIQELPNRRVIYKYNFSYMRLIFSLFYSLILDK